MKSKSMENRYSYLVGYDPKDDIYIARCVEMPSMIAHGDSHENAIIEVKKAVKSAIKWMKEEDEEIPIPLGFEKLLS